MIIISVSKTESGYTLVSEINDTTTADDIKKLSDVISKFTDSNSVHIYGGPIGKKNEEVRETGVELKDKKSEMLAGRVKCMNYEPYDEKDLLVSVPAEIDRIMEAIKKLPLSAKHNILNQVFDEFHEGMKKECSVKNKPAVNIPLTDFEEEELF